MQPKVLIASTTWWAMPARVASAFIKTGAEVSGVVPQGNPVRKVRSVRRTFAYRASRPLQALRTAIRIAKPDLIVPCDDRVVEHLHQLYAHSAARSQTDLCELIERSLGSPTGYNVTGNRANLLELADRLGIRVPETAVIRSLDTLKGFIASHPLPVVLKVDGTWGGSGVRVVRTMEEAEEAFHTLSQPLSKTKMLQHICHHDFFPLYSKADGQQSHLTVQAFVEGASANSMFACWKGEVLDHLSVETLFAVEQLGSSTIVRTIQESEMHTAGKLLAKELGISGFCGLDFILERTTGDAYLIELNPRATQNGHLEPGGRPSLVRVLCSKLAGEPSQEAAFFEETIAFFPHILRCSTEHLGSGPSKAFQDIPWDEPELVQDLMRKPWNRRHLSALVYAGGRNLVKRFTGETSS